MDDAVRIDHLQKCLIEAAEVAARHAHMKIHAIKFYRAATGASLKDSKDWVERLGEAQRYEDQVIRRIEDRLTAIERRL